MATTYKVLGQEAPAAASDTTLYTVPAATNAVCSTLTICNTGTQSALVRAAIRVANASITTKQYVVYDTALNPADSMFLTLGVTLAATDVVTIRSSTANVAFGLYGSELT